MGKTTADIETRLELLTESINELRNSLTTRMVDVATKAEQKRKAIEDSYTHEFIALTERLDQEQAATATAHAVFRRQVNQRTDKHVRNTACYVETVTDGLKRSIEDLDERITSEIKALSEKLDVLEAGG